jgi:hypothetical protein
VGHEAAVTKRKVLGKVEECVGAVNDALARVEVVADKHNAFTGELGTRFATVEDRLHAHGAWIDRTERLAVTTRSAVERQLAALAAKCGKDLETLDITAGRLYAGLIGHLVEVRAELAQARADADAFAQLGTFRRVWWVLSGHWPQPDRLHPASDTGVQRATDTNLADCPPSAGITAEVALP